MKIKKIKGFLRERQRLQNHNCGKENTKHYQEEERIKDNPDPWGIHLLGGKKAFDEWNENLPKATKEFLKKKGF